MQAGSRATSKVGKVEKAAVFPQGVVIKFQVKTDFTYRMPSIYPA
jgi:hypothetical protein